MSWKPRSSSVDLAHASERVIHRAPSVPRANAQDRSYHVSARKRVRGPPVRGSMICLYAYLQHIQVICCLRSRNGNARKPARSAARAPTPREPPTPLEGARSLLVAPHPEPARPQRCRATFSRARADSRIPHARSATRSRRHRHQIRRDAHHLDERALGGSNTPAKARLAAPARKPTSPTNNSH